MTSYDAINTQPVTSHRSNKNTVPNKKCTKITKYFNVNICDVFPVSAFLQ